MSDSKRAPKSQAAANPEGHLTPLEEKILRMRIPSPLPASAPLRLTSGPTYSVLALEQKLLLRAAQLQRQGTRRRFKLD